jgi:hypothetical protein
MSAILESVLDDERRGECHANDGAMAMGQPIGGSQHTIQPEHTSKYLVVDGLVHRSSLTVDVHKH